MTEHIVPEVVVTDGVFTPHEPAGVETGVTPADYTESWTITDEDPDSPQSVPNISFVPPVEPEIVYSAQFVTFAPEELIEEKKLPDTPMLTLPPKHETDMVKILSDLPNLPLDEGKQSALWASLIMDSGEKVSKDSMFVDCLTRKESDWRTGVDVNGTVLRGGYPIFAAGKGKELEGAQAVVRVLNHLGIGSIYSQPLWHSGFWVSFKPPTESELVDLNHAIASDKIKFGRHTYGLAFSNLTSYTVDRLLKFACDHIYETSIRQEDLSNIGILEILHTHDIPAFLTGFMASQYPRGFNYRRPCCNNPQTCTHVHEATLDLRWLTKEDNSRLTPYQKGHMTSRRRGSMSLDSIKRYRTEMELSHPRDVVIKQTIGNSITFQLGCPTANDYVDAGFRWIGKMAEMVDEAVGKDAGSVERNALIQQHGMASILCQFSHWVKEIRIGEQIVTQRSTLDNLLTHLSSDDEIRERLIQEIKRYIMDSTVAIVGIKTFDCPVCKKPNGDESNPNELQRELIPLDVVQVFTLLVSQRIARLARR